MEYAEYKSNIGIRAMHSIGEEAKKNGTSEMTLEEINAEIAAARAEMEERKSASK